MTTETKLDSIARKVGALLTQADHPNTGPAEANTFRAKAEALMLQYRLEESQLDRKELGSAIVPQWRTFTVCDYRSEYRSEYRWIADDIVRHFGCKAHTTYNMRDDTVTIEVCGYGSDLHFIEALWMTARLAFQQKLEPTYDPELSDQVNAYAMRNAGMEGRRIAEAIYGAPWTKTNCQKVRNMHKAECAERGEDAKALSGHVALGQFRTGYAAGFVDEFANRLRNMRLSRGMEATGLVLASRDENIAEAFYERFEQYRPAAPGTKVIGNEQAECAKCAKAKSGYCRDHAWKKPRSYKGPKLSREGIARGRTAAQGVDLGQGAQKRLEGN